MFQRVDQVEFLGVPGQHAEERDLLGRTLQCNDTAGARKADEGLLGSLVAEVVLPPDLLQDQQVA